MRNGELGMRSARIGIVGAGASGLTVAHFLAEEGYENVILFERRERVGGKCESVTIDGHVYELGAVLGAPHYEVIGELASRAGLAYGRCVPSHYYEPQGQRTALYPWPKFPHLLLQLFGKLAWLSVNKYHALYEPGLANIDPDLYENFETFAGRYGLAEVPALFQQVTTGFGYGYAEQVPAAYLLKYLSWPMIWDCARGNVLRIHVAGGHPDAVAEPELRT
jgi:phytoene dehydrogenase-like protein